MKDLTESTKTAMAMGASIKPTTVIGRPRGDYSKHIGTVHNGLEINSVMFIKGAVAGPYAQATCQCGKVSISARLYDVLRGHTKSCKCLKSTVYRELCTARVSRMPEAHVAKIWEARFVGSSRKAVADMFNLPMAICDFAVRRYQIIVDGLASTWRFGRQLAIGISKVAGTYIEKVGTRLRSHLHPGVSGQSAELMVHAYLIEAWACKGKSDWETMQVRRGINDFLSGVEKPKYSPGVQTGFDVTDEDLDDMDPGEAGRLRDMAAKEQARGLPERKSWFGSLVTVPV